MGEHADDLVEGLACELCSTFFWQAHGYPVVCNDCWKDLTTAERKVHQKAVHKEMT